jgi:signal transduction histidine kinase/DNA-binding response OmpR family regulator
MTEAGHAGTDPRGLDILVVDDSQVQILLAKELLAAPRYGHRVHAAASGEEALDRLQDTRYDLVLLDYNLPGMNGLEALRAIVARRQELPVILVTGSGSERIAVEAMKAGATDYVMKGENHHALLPTVVEQAWQQTQLLRRNKKLLEELQASHRDILQRNLELSALYAIGTAVGSSLDLAEILSDALRTVLEILQMEAGWIGLPTEESSRLRLASHRGLSLPGAEELAADDGLAQRAMSGQPLIIDDLATFPGEIPVAARREGFRSLIVVPLRRKAQTLGIMGAASGTPRKLAPSEGQLLTSIGHQIGVAIENASLYQQVRGHSQLLEQRVAERTRELVQRNREIEAASRHKSEFLAKMSHELRTPLNSVIGFSELLAERLYGPLNERQAKYIGNIRSSGRHLLQLINDILDLAKVEAGKMELCLDEFPVAQALAEVLSTLKNQADRDEISLASQVEPRASTFVADPRKFKQILYNLATNAIKFNRQQGKVFVNVRVAEGGGLEVSVADTGIGIPPEEGDRIFKPFEQVDSSLARRYEGSGLGLALTKELVELHGGTIGFTSEVGRGSTFVFSLPPAKPPTLAEALRPLKVLIADDDPNVVELLSGLLEPRGFHILKASGGQQAIECAREQAPDLVILDLMMPEVTGFDVVRSLKVEAATKHIPILIVTAKDLTPAEEGSLIRQVDAILQKGALAKEEILQRIDSLERNRGRRPSPEALGTGDPS